MSDLSVGKNKSFAQAADTDIGKLYDFGYCLFVARQYAAAYSIFSKIVDRQPETGVLFNLALCCIEAEEYPAALRYLDDALAALKNTGLPSNNRLQDAVYQKLAEKQRQTDDYKNAMEREFPAYFTELCEERLWRLKIDVLAALQLWPQVLQYGGRWANCSNVAQAITKAKQQ